MSQASFPFSRSDSATATDALLIETLRACAGRSVPALQRLHALTAPRLLGELLQLLGDREAAEAALEECYVHIWQQAGTFSPERCGPFIWMRAIARQYAIASLREQQPALPPEEVDAGLQLLAAGLAEQHPGQATGANASRLLQLAYLSGRSSTEIARAMQLPLEQVQRQIRAGLRQLGQASP